MLALKFNKKQCNTHTHAHTHTTFSTTTFSSSSFSLSHTHEQWFFPMPITAGNGKQVKLWLATMFVRASLSMLAAINRGRQVPIV